MNSAFQQAVLEGDTTKVKFLLRFSPGIQVNQTNKNGLTPLLQSCNDGHIMLVHVLLDNGADLGAVDQNGWSALHIAAAKGHTGIVNLLIDSCADVKSRSLQNERPIDIAKTREIKITLGEAMLNAESKSRNSMNLEETWGDQLPFITPGCRASIATSSTDSNTSEDSGIGLGFERNRRGGGSLKLFSHKERERLSRVTFMGSEVSEQDYTKCGREERALHFSDEKEQDLIDQRRMTRCLTEPIDYYPTTVEPEVTKIGRSSSFVNNRVDIFARRREKCPERRKKLILRTENSYIYETADDVVNIRKKIAGPNARDLTRRKTFTFGEEFPLRQNTDSSDVASLEADIASDIASTFSEESESSDTLNDLKEVEIDGFRKRGSGGSLRMKRCRKYLSSFFSG